MPKDLPVIVHKGNEGYCPSCDSRLGRFKQGPRDVPLYHVGRREADGRRELLEIKQVHLEPGQSLFYLVVGYALGDECWDLDPHARKNYERTGDLTSRHGREKPMGVAYPDPIKCFHCGEKCTVDKPKKT
jgi:hypothetical protein